MTNIDAFDRIIVETYVDHVFDALGNGPHSFEQILKQYRELEPYRLDAPTTIHAVLQTKTGIVRDRSGYRRGRS